MRLIDADALEKEFCHGCQYENNKYVNCIDCAVANAPTVCCETCKHGIKGEHINGHEYVSCVKPYAGVSNYHTKDWFCGDWKNKNAID